MRIFRLILSSFLFFTFISVIGFFIAREILLYVGVNVLKSSFKELNSAKSKGNYTVQCMQLGSNAIGGEDVVTYQIRFLSSSEYLVEAVCEGFLYEPILLSRATLPKFVTKVPGTSGLTLSNIEQSGVALQVFAVEIKKITQEIGVDASKLIKQKSLIAEDGILVQTALTDLPSNGPVTVCAGYGYECCNEVSHFGAGDKIVGLNDCEDSCYASCKTRPILLSLNTNPMIDPRTRSITVPSGSPVEFTFVADFGTATGMSGVIDFGNGKKALISGLAGQSSHTYECATTSCTYIASITLEDNWGTKSADLQTSKVTIIVTQ